MDEYIERSGTDRRKQDSPVAVERRHAMERRTGAHTMKLAVEFMKKIPLFKGFTDDQYNRVFHICSKRTIEKGSYVYYEGEDSTDLYILVQGRLRITIKGTTLSILYPLSMVGEIGVFTDGNRSASVFVDEDATVIRIPKKELLVLMRDDLMLSNHILHNVVNDLVGKLQEDNRIIHELRKEKNTLIM